MKGLHKTFYGTTKKCENKDYVNFFSSSGLGTGRVKLAWYWVKSLDKAVIMLKLLSFFPFVCGGILMFPGSMKKKHWPEIYRKHQNRSRSTISLKMLLKMFKMNSLNLLQKNSRRIAEFILLYSINRRHNITSIKM